MTDMACQVLVLGSSPCTELLHFIHETGEPFSLNFSTDKLHVRWEVRSAWTIESLEQDLETILPRYPRATCFVLCIGSLDLDFLEKGRVIAAYKRLVRGIIRLAPLATSVVMCEVPLRSPRVTTLGCHSLCQLGARASRRSFNASLNFPVPVRLEIAHGPERHSDLNHCYNGNTGVVYNQSALRLLYMYIRVRLFEIFGVANLF